MHNDDELFFWEINYLQNNDDSFGGSRFSKPPSHLEQDFKLGKIEVLTLSN